MMQTMLVAVPLLSVMFFPLSLSAFFALAAAYVAPAAPLATGLFADALYYTPGAASFPFYTVVGLAASLAALLVRRFVETSIMRG